MLRAPAPTRSLLAAVLVAWAGLAVAADPPAAGADPPAGGASRLAQSPSSFLRDHAGNLVDWHPWGEEAFAAARERQLPILLSIGFATCHWCHVMARESFCDREVAAEINRHYLPILVDREELPTVDAYYSAFVSAEGGEAGWPLLVVLAPDRQPIVGTSFLHRQRLLAVLQAFDQRWSTDAAALITLGAGAVARLAAAPGAVPPPSGRLDAAALRTAALAAAAADFDPIDAGFGPAPKFPQPLLLQLLLRPEASADDHQRAQATIAHLAGGAIRDILGGGFHRYTVDAAWRVPHFEKMLIDQAELALVFSRAAQLLHDAQDAGLAEECLAYADTRLRDPSGACIAGEDADSLTTDPADGPPHLSEGAYYRWTMAGVSAALAPLGGQAADGLSVLTGVSALFLEGNVPPMFDSDGELRGSNLLRLGRPPGEADGLPPARAAELLRQDLELLRQARERRPAPARDTEVLVGWNGVLIQAMAETAPPGRPSRWLDAAERIAGALRQAWDADGGLAHTLGGRHGSATTLDAAELIGGLVALHRRDGSPSWLEWALALQERLDARSWDPAHGTYLDAPPGADGIGAVRGDIDGEEPCASSAEALALVALCRLKHDARLEQRRDQLLAGLAAAAAAHPLALPGLIAAISSAAAPDLP